MVNDYLGMINMSNDLSSSDKIKRSRNENKFIEGNLTFVYDEKATNIANNKELFVYFHGDCFNHSELKNDLKLEDDNIDIAKLILALFQKHQMDCFALIRGKFSVVIWDKTNNVCYGVRDHFGVIPIFYYETADLFIFSSSKSKIMEVVEANKVNLQALQHYFSFQYVPEPMTLNKAINIVDPGTSFIKSADQTVKFSKFWRAKFNPVNKSEEQWKKEIRNKLLENVEARLVARGEVGSLLSGGIDSTFIVALAKEINPNIKTFSVGFEREGFSEVSLAKETATELNVENISKIITAEEYVAELPEIILNLEEPLADPSCVPLYFAAKEASKHLNIVLSGEGADEFFGGYNIYHEPQSLSVFNYLPRFLKKYINYTAGKLPKDLRGKDFLLRGTTPLQERYIGNAKMFEEKEKRDFLKHYNPNISYKQITEEFYQDVADLTPVTQMQYIDINTWLRGDILFKAEKMAKANCVDVRMPFVDKALFDIARKIPVDLKINNRTTKYILREAARGIIPDNVLNRKKLGFPVPIRHWLKRELNSWAKDLIMNSHVDEYIDKQYVLKLLEKHCEGRVDYSRRIWTFLMFMIWHQVFIEQKYEFTQPKEIIV